LNLPFLTYIYLGIDYWLTCCYASRSSNVGGGDNGDRHRTANAAFSVDVFDTEMNALVYDDA
jgi:hypothetical protein